MKRIKFTESQIVKAIKEHESGKNGHDLCRELGISTAAFYKWRQRYFLNLTFYFGNIQYYCSNLTIEFYSVGNLPDMRHPAYLLV